MTDKEKIKAKIAEIKGTLMDDSGVPFTMQDEGAYDILSELETYIDSMQKEPVSEDLENAAKDSGQRHFPDEYNIWARPNYEARHAALAFKEGAKWQKEQMIDKACEWLSKEISIYVSYDGEIDEQELLDDFKKAMED